MVNGICLVLDSYLLIVNLSYSSWDDKEKSPKRRKRKGILMVKCKIRGLVLVTFRVSCNHHSYSTTYTVIKIYRVGRV